MGTIKYNDYTIVDGVLQLDDLRVEGSLFLNGCTALTALPDGLSVGGFLYLEGCTGLTALPDGLSVGRSLYLKGCTSITALPEGLSVGGWICLDDLRLSKDQAMLINTPIAHSIRTTAIGRPLGDLVDHWAMSWNGMRDKIIESIDEDEDGDLAIILKKAVD